MTELSIDDLLQFFDDEPPTEDDAPGDLILQFDDDDTSPAQGAPAGQREHFSLLPVDYDPSADPIPAGPNADLYAGQVIVITDRRTDALRNPPALNGRRTFRQGNRARALRWAKRGPGCLPVLCG